MSYAATDLLLAILHHILVFSLAGIVAFEIATIRSDMTTAQIGRVARIDVWYGVFAALILAIGFSRATFAAKGWAYYSTNYFFWAKLASFAIVGLLSIYPTVMIIRWRRETDKSPIAAPRLENLALVQRCLWLEALGFAFIVSFAAAMARGYGSP